MRNLYYLFITAFVIAIFFYRFFLHGLLPIPSDTLIGLYNPFRDLYAQQYPRGIPFKNFLITDPIRQQIPWKVLSLSIERNLELPLWNPYSFSGYPLLANFQSAALYPFNIFFFLMPFSYSWSLLIVLQPLLGGIFLYLYLRNLKLHHLACVLGSFIFAFSGFSIAWIEWGTILQTLMWVPLILLAKDMLIEKWSIKWTLVFLFSEVTAFLAGHLQIWFYSICLTNAYLFLRLFQKTKLQKTKNFFFQYQKNYLPFFLIGITMFAITAIQWLPTLQFIFHSARSIDQNYLTTAGWFLPYQNLIQFVAPDFFGNPTTLNYWGIWNYAEFVGYIGMIPLIFVFFAILFRHDKKTYFWSCIFIIAFLFALPTPLGLLPYALHLPFISTSQPTRLMGIIDFSLAILAALGIDEFFRKKSIGILSIMAIFGVVFVTLWLVLIKFYTKFGISIENAHVAKQNLIFPTSLLIISLIILLAYLFFFKNKKITLLISWGILIFACIDLFRFGWKFIPFTSQAYLYPSTASIAYLQKNIGNYRFMTTDSRILPPNVSDVYRLQSIEGYDPLYLQNYGGFISAMQRNKPDISTPFGFNRIITPHDTTSSFINLLGVKYVVSLDDIRQAGLQKVYTEGSTKIYKNENVLPRAFFIKQVISSSNQQDAINKMYSYKMDLNNIAIVYANIQASKFETNNSYVSITRYSANFISMLTSAKSEEFLVFTDIYYPTWHAYIDGKETKIYETDFTFRGIIVPAGKHVVEFKDQLF